MIALKKNGMCCFIIACVVYAIRLDDVLDRGIEFENEKEAYFDTEDHTFHVTFYHHHHRYCHHYNCWFSSNNCFASVVVFAFACVCVCVRLFAHGHIFWQHTK